MLGEDCCCSKAQKAHVKVGLSLCVRQVHCPVLHRQVRSAAGRRSRVLQGTPHSRQCQKQLADHEAANRRVEIVTKTPTADCEPPRWFDHLGEGGALTSWTSAPATSPRSAIGCASRPRSGGPPGAPVCEPRRPDRDGRAVAVLSGPDRGHPAPLSRLDRRQSIAYLLRFLAFGEGETAPVTREVIRQAEPDPGDAPAFTSGKGVPAPVPRPCDRSDRRETSRAQDVRPSPLHSRIGVHRSPVSSSVTPADGSSPRRSQG